MVDSFTKDVLNAASSKLSPFELKKLSYFIVKRKNFFRLPEDVSFKGRCFDACGESLKVGFGGKIHQSGGYCSENKTFREIIDKVYKLVYPQEKSVPIEDLGERVPPSKKNQYPKLDTPLSNLVKAKNLQEVARKEGFEVIDNKIRVSIQLANPKYQLPSEFGEEEIKDGVYLQALIYIDKIPALVEDPNIISIHKPFYALPLGE